MIKNCKKGFTLLELLVVVLIIGILASIALPQYEMAVTKAKVASILPLMRRFKDALAEYKLQHGDYADIDNGIYPNCSDLGVNWPSDWSDGNCEDDFACTGDYWDCMYNEDYTGYVSCNHYFGSADYFNITMFQSDDENFANMITCYAEKQQGTKVCKALGGKLIDGYDNYYQL